MNKREQLLAETFGDSTGDTFALRAAAQARRRRLAKQAGLAAGLTCTLAAALLLTHQPANLLPPIAIAPAPASPAFEIMSDEDLVTQLRDQPVMVVKNETGITRVIFLDQKPAHPL